MCPRAKLVLTANKVSLDSSFISLILKYNNYNNYHIAYTHTDTHLYIHAIIQSLHQLIQLIVMLCFLVHKHKTLDYKQIDRPSRTVSESAYGLIYRRIYAILPFIISMYTTFTSACSIVTNTIKKLTFSKCWRPYSLQNCSEKFVKNHHFFQLSRD